MHKLKVTKAFFLSIILIVAAQPTANSLPSKEKELILKKDDCGLLVENPHLSDSLRKKGIKAVKVNVISKCIYVQERIVFNIELLKRGYFGWKIVKSFPRIITKPKPSPFRVEIKDAYVECKNIKPTLYWARAFSTVTIAGKSYSTPLVYSQNNRLFRCGT